ncbi:hypothetical protein [Sagittula sp. S175]|uniref:hypothetical protein n=1 Tax=Sagittula sp. S175 TaxID=3415129 RepID=UPI003C7B3F33
MATQAALMMAFAIVTMLLPLIVLKEMAKRVISKRRGEDAAARSDEAARFVIVTLTAGVMCGAVLLLGPDALSADMIMASR